MHSQDKLVYLRTCWLENVEQQYKLLHIIFTLLIYYYWLLLCTCFGVIVGDLLGIVSLNYILVLSLTPFLHLPTYGSVTMCHLTRASLFWLASYDFSVVSTVLYFAFLFLIFRMHTRFCLLSVFLHLLSYFVHELFAF